MKSGVGCHDRIEVVAGNCGGGWYFSSSDSDESDGGKGYRNRVYTITEDLVDIVSQYLEGGTAMHKGEGG